MDGHTSKRPLHCEDSRGGGRASLRMGEAAPEAARLGGVEILQGKPAVPLQGALSAYSSLHPSSSK